MAQIQQPTTKVVDTLTIGGTGAKAVKSAKELATKANIRLGSPIAGKNVGETFPVTLTGNIEIRDFNGAKSAHFTTKEGYSIRVNASFDASKHKADSVHTAVCRLLEKNEEQGIMRDIKYTSFVD